MRRIIKCNIRAHACNGYAEQVGFLYFGFKIFIYNVPEYRVFGKILKIGGFFCRGAGNHVQEKQYGCTYKSVRVLYSLYRILQHAVLALGLKAGFVAGKLCIQLKRQLYNDCPNVQAIANLIENY